MTSRAVVSTVTIVMAILLVPVAATGWWVRSTVSDTEHYLAVVGPLANDAELQHAAADAIIEAAAEQLSVVDLDEQTPGLLGGLELPDGPGQLLSGAQSPLKDGALAVVNAALDHAFASSAFAHAWRAVHATAHRQALFVLEGRSELATTENGVVQVELGPVVSLVLTELQVVDDSLAHTLRGLDVSIPLFSQAALEQVQSVYAMLMETTLVMPVVAAVMVLIGVGLARHRARTYLRFALVTPVLVVATPPVINAVAVGSGPSDPNGHVLVSALAGAAIQPLQSLSFLLAGALVASGLTAAAGCRFRARRSRLGQVLMRGVRG